MEEEDAASSGSTARPTTTARTPAATPARSQGNQREELTATGLTAQR